MSLILLTLGVLFGALVIHFAIWRIRVPKRATKTLLFLAMSGLVIMLGIDWWWLREFDPAKVLYAVVLYGAIAVCYILTYTAIEADSPTLSLIYYIDASGCAGRTLPEIEDFFSNRPFVQSRLAQLVQGGFVVRRGPYVELTTRSGLVVRATEYYRGLMMRTTKGG